MATASIPSPSHQTSTNNHQQGQGQQSNQAARVGGHANNDERVQGMQRSGMNFNPSQHTYLLFPPEPTGVRPPKSDITQYQDPADRAHNKPQASGQPINHNPGNTRNPVPNPPAARYWACCQDKCEERGGANLAEYYIYCLVCNHRRCRLCPAGNDQYFAKRTEMRSAAGLLEGGKGV